ncbi:hypothetical protein JP74_09740 [Devosia sp. 17-2-E-8]|nr:hypothetical protein JP74_09740 [Devosia sp. 17-2-E-8]QMV04207.1 GNAT family N-acetyltransferase [Devosia sp. D6-9]
MPNRISRQPIITERLELRPSVARDAEPAFVIRSDWEVARMLSRATFPPDRAAMEAWFGEHEREWREGRAYRFAVERGGRVIGIVDIDGVADSEGELGYWFEKASWGQGYAFEAGSAVVRFGFDVVGLRRIRAGHAVDNAASGRVLEKLGFSVVETVWRESVSRGERVEVRRLALARETLREVRGWVE